LDALKQVYSVHNFDFMSARRGPTAFQQLVYEKCRAIPVGKVATYGELVRPEPVLRDTQ
jgi:O6-methylguanine-DNA--protein-cysteine methyltransferase